MSPKNQTKTTVTHLADVTFSTEVWKGRKISLWTNSPRQLRSNPRSPQKIWLQNVRTTGWNPNHPGVFKLLVASCGDENPELHKSNENCLRASNIKHPWKKHGSGCWSKVLQQWCLLHLGSPEMCYSPTRSSPSFLAAYVAAGFFSAVSNDALLSRGKIWCIKQRYLGWPYHLHFIVEILRGIPTMWFFWLDSKQWQGLSTF